MMSYMFVYVLTNKLITFVGLVVTCVVLSAMTSMMTCCGQMRLVHDIMSHTMWFNVPIIYLMVTNLDLTISAVMTIRHESYNILEFEGHNAWFNIISVVLAWIYLIALTALIAVLTFVIVKAENLLKVSNRIGFVKFGVRYHSKRPILVFMIWFFVFRLLLAINVSLIGVIS